MPEEEKWDDRPAGQQGNSQPPSITDADLRELEARDWEFGEWRRAMRRIRELETRVKWHRVRQSRRRALECGAGD